MPPIIRLEHLGKDFVEGGQTRSVLHDVNAAFNQGEFVAIRGRSGSGKSTLLNLIAGLDVPTAGEIFVAEVRLTGLSPHERTLFRRDNIGFVFQFFNLIPTLTVLENVRLPAELAGLKSVPVLTRPDSQTPPRAPGRTGAEPGQERSAGRLEARALALLERVGLADRGEVFPDRLSGGEQQRVAIARALMHDPRIVLADEPTGNLDEKTGLAVMALLDEMTRGQGKTLIMVTHSRRMAAPADHVFELHDGSLVEESRNVARP